MSNIIKFIRGAEADIPVLSQGEPAFTTDTKKVFIGDGAANHQLAMITDTQNKLLWVYPQDYATGTGTAIDPWAGDCLDDAYTACPTGGTIYLRAGYYQMDNALLVTKAINIIGEGMGKTIIVTANAHGIQVGSVDADADYSVTMKNFTIDGAAGTDNTYKAPIRLDRCYRIVMENVEAMNGGQFGINLYNGSYMTFNNVYVHDNYEDGMHTGTALVDGSYHDCTFNNIHCYDNGDNGFDAGGSTYYGLNNSYNNIYAWGNTHNGVAFTLEQNSIMSNVFSWDNGTRGLYVSDVKHCVINGGEIYSNGSHGIQISDSNNVYMANVIVKNNADSGIGIWGCDDVTLSSCQSYDDRGVGMVQPYGVIVGEDSLTNISFVNCTFTPNDTGTISNAAVLPLITFNGVVNDYAAVAGDIQYHNGTNWVRLAKGTTLQSFAMNAGATAPEWVAVTGTGSVVRATSPSLTTPALGTPSAVVLTNASGTAASLTAGAATALANARTIGGVSFDGTANIVPTSLSIAGALSSDHTYLGIVDSKNVGENVVFGDLLYFDWTATEWKKAKADAAATTPAMRIALETKADGEACLMLVQGYIRDDSTFQFTAAIGYLSITTAGAVQYAVPSVAGNQIQRVGIGISADILFFNPSMDVGEI